MGNLLLAKKDIGIFCSKMYESNSSRDIEVTIRPDERKIVIYYKSRAQFEYVDIVDEDPNISNLVNTLSHE